LSLGFPCRGVIAAFFLFVIASRSVAISVGMGLRSLASGFCSCLIHQAQLPNKLGNYSFKPLLAMTKRFRNVVRGFSLVRTTLKGLKSKGKNEKPVSIKLIATKLEIAEPVPSVKRGISSSEFCSCLIHQAQLPNKLGNYIVKIKGQK